MPPLKTKQQLAKEQKASNVRERLIAKQYLQAGPSISNLYNAFTHWYKSVPFLGGQPETGHVFVTGDPPAAGIKNLGKIIKAAKVTGELNNTVAKGLKPALKRNVKPITRTKDGYRRTTPLSDLSWQQATDIYNLAYKYPIGYDNRGLLFTNKNYFFRRGYDLIDDALNSGVIRVPSGDYKPAVLEKYPFLDDGNPFSTMKISHKFPYFSEGELWPLKYSDTALPDLIAIPNNIKGVKWVAGSKFGTLKESAKPSEFGGRGTPLINGEVNAFPSKNAMFYRFNMSSGRYEPLGDELILTDGPFDLPYWNMAPAEAIKRSQYTKPDGLTLKKIFSL